MICLKNFSKGPIGSTIQVDFACVSSDTRSSACHASGQQALKNEIKIMRAVCNFSGQARSSRL